MGSVFTNLINKLHPKKVAPCTSATSSIALIGGQYWTSAGIKTGDIILDRTLIHSIGILEKSNDINELDVSSRLVTPGLIDSWHPLHEDNIPPMMPGPYLDRLRREEAINRNKPEALSNSAKIPVQKLIDKGVVNCLLNGVTAAASPVVRNEEYVKLRMLKSRWIEALLWEKNPKRILAKSDDVPIIVSAADGTGRSAIREIAQLDSMGAISDKLMICGGAGLSRTDAEKLAQAGAYLIWQPLVDRFVLGQTIPPEVFEVRDLKVLIGAGSTRDGGDGLLAAMQAADRFGYLDRSSLINAVTAVPAQAFNLMTGKIEPGYLADLAVWSADSFEEAIFVKGREALELVIVDGIVVLAREKWIKKFGQGQNFYPVKEAEGFWGLFEV